MKTPVAQVLIKPTCIETHGGADEAFNAMTKELKRRFDLWILEGRTYRFEMYIEE